MKTVTYDPTKYKLVPVRSASEMDSAADVSLYVGPWGASDIWDKMLAAVPDQLLVVEHSGEPIGFLYQGESAFSFVEPDAHPHILGALGAFPVFTHPAPSQPSAEQPWHERIRGMEVSVDISTGEGDAYHRIYGRVNEVMLAENGAGVDTILAEEEGRNFTQPSAEALVQAALEAALDAVQNVEINCDASGAAIGSAERRIRALSAQQIIESCKEKS